MATQAKPRLKKIASSTKTFAEATPVPVGDLSLDHMNPRLTDPDLKPTDQDVILKRLWQDFNVSEIVYSIITSHSFWKHEPLIAAKENGKLIVVEGNRRLAAVQLLLSPEKQKLVGATGIPTIDEALREELSTLPVVEESREKVWDFVGFKHVNGPQEWDSIAKAQYIARIHDEYHKELPDIAKAIGDQHATVARLYHGLKVLEQAEKSGVFDRNDRFYQRKDFAYSHLWTGIALQGIREFLGIKEGKRNEREPVPTKKLPALGELCRWLYGSKKEELEPLVKSQNPHLRQLDEALRKERGVSALRSGLPLQTAVKAAQGDERLLLDALVAGEQNLREAKAYFSTGYRGQQEISDTIKKIQLLSASLSADLETANQKK